jgi:hypothetical protein
MARKARKARAARKSNGATAQPASTLKLIAEPEFKRLLTNVRNAEKDKDEATASIGGLVSKAAQRGLDKKAFAATRQELKMSDARLATFYAHQEHYRKIAGLHERAERQQQMFDRPELEQFVAPADADEDALVEVEEFEPEAT